ncbi:MAG: DUF4190 domain-containing protein [Candidatus Thermoplasmatota archaeon]|nr:DUF4190 domain-containing protein [Candidatus Thermoplasmatota archaeon]
MDKMEGNEWTDGRAEGGENSYGKEPWHSQGADPTGPPRQVPPLGYNTTASGYDQGSISRDYGPPYDPGYSPNTSYYDTAPPKNDEGARGLGMASMIMGICSLGMTFFGMFFSGLCCLSFLVSIIGLPLGAVSLSKYRRTGAEEGKGMAVAGIIMNSIDLGIAALGFLIMVLLIGLIVGTGSY